MEQKPVTRADIAAWLPGGRLVLRRPWTAALLLDRIMMLSGLCFAGEWLLAGLLKAVGWEVMDTTLFARFMLATLAVFGVSGALLRSHDTTGHALLSSVKRADPDDLVLDGMVKLRVRWTDLEGADWLPEQVAVVRWRKGRFVLRTDAPGQELLLRLIDRVVQARRLGCLVLDAPGDADDQSLSRVRMTDEADNPARGISLAEQDDEP